jgi:hypothetical protein
MIRPPAAPAAEVFRLTRIRRHDIGWYGKQWAEAKGIIAALADGSTVCYTDRKPDLRILCGSV